MKIQLSDFERCLIMEALQGLPDCQDVVPDTLWERLGEAEPYAPCHTLAEWSRRHFQGL
jgi:hypothetical protein